MSEQVDRQDEGLGLAALGGDFGPRQHIPPTGWSPGGQDKPSITPVECLFVINRKPGEPSGNGNEGGCGRRFAEKSDDILSVTSGGFEGQKFVFRE